MDRRGARPSPRDGEARKDNVGFGFDCTSMGVVGSDGVTACGGDGGRGAGADAPWSTERGLQVGERRGPERGGALWCRGRCYPQSAAEVGDGSPAVGIGLGDRRVCKKSRKACAVGAALLDTVGLVKTLTSQMRNLRRPWRMQNVSQTCPSSRLE